MVYVCDVVAWRVAVDVLEEMWERGMKVEASVYNLVLDCCREGRHWRRALQVGMVYNVYSRLVCWGQ